jgi:hypothetical protein
MNSRIFSYPNQTICSVLEAMRDCHKTRNYSYLEGLIENAQYLANKLESALADKRDIREWTELRDEMKKEMKELEKQLEAKKKELG